MGTIQIGRMHFARLSDSSSGTDFRWQRVTRNYIVFVYGFTWVNHFIVLYQHVGKKTRHVSYYCTFHYGLQSVTNEDLLLGNSGHFSPRKASCNRAALPGLSNPPHWWNVYRILLLGQHKHNVCYSARLYHTVPRFFQSWDNRYG